MKLRVKTTIKLFKTQLLMVINKILSKKIVFLRKRKKYLQVMLLQNKLQKKNQFRGNHKKASYGLDWRNKKGKKSFKSGGI